MRFTFQVSFSLKAPPPLQEAAVLFSTLELCAPVLGSEGQVSPFALVLPLLDVCRDVRLCPPLMGLQSDQTLFTQ